MRTRLNAFIDWLKQEELDMAFISSPANVFYLSNFECDPHERLLGLVIFPDKDPFLVCPQMEASQAKDAGWTGEIVDYGDGDDPWALIAKALRKRDKHNSRSLAIEKSALPYGRAEKCAALFSNVTFANAEEKLQELRMIKDSQELKILREAAQLADFGVKTGVAAIAEGKTETQILAEIEYELKKKGVTQMAFSTMVLTGENAARPHGTPGTSKVTAGDFVLFDLGVVLDGYCSDITRTVAFRDVSEQQKNIYDTVLGAQQAALSISKTDTRIGDIDQTARNTIHQAGYGDYFPHRIGHGLGIEPHESPSMSGNNDDVLKPGMVYTIEPGIYVPNVAGVRIEDDVVVTENGSEPLTQYPKELQVIK